MPSNHLVLCHPLLLLGSIIPSIRVFSNESSLTSGGQGIEASASASASVLPMDIQDWFPLGFTGLISCFPRDSQESSLTHSSKASVLQCSFFRVQLSHPYLTTGKTIALTIQTIVGKIMSLFFNTLSRFVIAFLPKSKRLLISCLKSPFAVILEPKKIKSVTV